MSENHITLSKIETKNNLLNILLFRQKDYFELTFKNERKRVI